MLDVSVVDGNVGGHAGSLVEPQRHVNEGGCDEESREDVKEGILVEQRRFEEVFLGSGRRGRGAAGGGLRFAVLRLLTRGDGQASSLLVI